MLKLFFIIFRFAESGQRPTEGSSGETVDFISANKEMYDFMWQKMGGIAGSLQVRFTFFSYRSVSFQKTSNNSFAKVHSLHYQYFQT